MDMGQAESNDKAKALSKIVDEDSLASINYTTISLEAIVQDESSRAKYGEATVTHQSIKSINGGGGRYIISRETFGTNEDAKKRMEFLKDPIDPEFNREWGDKTSVWNEGFTRGCHVYIIWTEADAFAYKMIPLRRTGASCSGFQSFDVLLRNAPN